MPDRKRPEDIEPAKTGVKLKRKTPPQIKEQGNPQVITNVAKNVDPDQLPPPTEDAIRISNRMNIARQRLIKSLKSFNKLLSSGDLPENRPVKDKEEEQAIIAEMTNAALEIDQVSNGEGTLALSIFAVRQAIFFRDAGNKLAYEISEIKKKLAELEKDNIKEDPDEAAKQQRVKDLAKELGVEVTVNKK